MADGNLIGGLILALLMDELFDGEALFDEPLFEPAAGEVQHGILARQALAEFRHERAREWKIGSGHVRDHHDEVRRIFFRHRPAADPPTIREVAILARDGEPVVIAPEIFNQPQAQHDGNGPELAEFQRLTPSDRRRRTP